MDFLAGLRRQWAAREDRRARRLDQRATDRLLSTPAGTPVPEDAVLQLAEAARSGRLERTDDLGLRLTAFTLSGPPAPATDDPDGMGYLRSAARAALMATGPMREDWDWILYRCQFRAHGLIYQLTADPRTPPDLLATVIEMPWENVPWCLWTRPDLPTLLNEAPVRDALYLHVRSAPHEGSTVLRSAWREQESGTPSRRALWTVLLDTVPEMAAELVPEARQTVPLTRDDLIDLCAHDVAPVRAAAIEIMAHGVA